MPRFIVELWETRSYVVPVEAKDADDAKEIAEDMYAELSTQDSFVSVEIRDVEPETK